MLANYGYKDGSGDFFITIDTEKCNGCGECIPICPLKLFELVEDEFDIDSEMDVIAVKKDQTNKIKYSCAVCKPSSGYNLSDLPCVKACKPGAIEHSW